MLLQAEIRAEFAERSVQALQKEADRLKDDFRAEQERNERMEATARRVMGVLEKYEAGEKMVEE